MYKHVVILKSGINLNDENGQNKIIGYFEYLKSSFENYDLKIHFSKTQIQNEFELTFGVKKYEKKL